MPADWWRSSRIRVLVPLLLILGIGAYAVFVLVGIALDQIPSCYFSNGYPVVSSVEELPDRTHIAVVRVAGAPTKGTSESGMFIYDDFPVIVDKYLLGSGADSLLVRVSAEHICPDGSSEPVERSLGLKEGKSYVLFLRPGSPGYWIPLAEPGGFQLDGDVLVPNKNGLISPADWGVSTLGDLEGEIERLEALPPPTALSAPDSS